MLAAVTKAGHQPVWVVPPNVSRSESECWRQAARGLARNGSVRAVYVRRPDGAGRWFGHLAVVAPDNPRTTDTTRSFVNGVLPSR